MAITRTANILSNTMVPVLTMYLLDCFLTAAACIGSGETADRPDCYTIFYSIILLRGKQEKVDLMKTVVIYYGRESDGQGICAVVGKLIRVRRRVYGDGHGLERFVGYSGVPVPAFTVY